MEKLIILNRKQQKISVVIEQTINSQGLAFVMHGLGGFKEQPHIQTFKDVFQEQQFTTILFDTTNTLGSHESEGDYENATVTNYLEDLEDVIEWAKQQTWYQEPFWLCGHSIGGMCITLYAEKNSEIIKGLAPIATVISGKVSLNAPKYRNNNILKQWEKTGMRIEESKSQPGKLKKLKWQHMLDRQKYDIIADANTLTMPILMIVGTEDSSTPPEHQELLFKVLPHKKEIHHIKDSGHNFRDQKYLNQIKQIMVQWIQKVQE